MLRTDEYFTSGPYARVCRDQLNLGFSPELVAEMSAAVAIGKDAMVAAYTGRRLKTELRRAIRVQLQERLPRLQPAAAGDPDAAGAHAYLTLHIAFSRIPYITTRLSRHTKYCYSYSISVPGPASADTIENTRYIVRVVGEVADGFDAHLRGAPVRVAAQYPALNLDNLHLVGVKYSSNITITLTSPQIIDGIEDQLADAAVDQLADAAVDQLADDADQFQ